MKLLDYKTTKKISGIYCIENTINGKKYIGRSKNLYARVAWHKNALTHDFHHNDHLQRAWDKYGEDSFHVFVIEFNLVEHLNEREAFYINKYNTLDRNFGYNIEEISMAYKNMSEETKRKISERMKGRKPEKALLKIKELLLSGDSPFKNRIYHADTGEKGRKTRAAFSKERKAEISLKLSIKGKARGRNYQEKETALLDSDFNIIKTYRSARDLCKDYPEFSHSQVVKICRGVQKKKIYKGYSFMYTNNKI